MKLEILQKSNDNQAGETYRACYISVWTATVRTDT